MSLQRIAISQSSICSGLGLSELQIIFRVCAQHKNERAGEHIFFTVRVKVMIDHNNEIASETSEFYISASFYKGSHSLEYPKWVSWRM